MRRVPYSHAHGGYSTVPSPRRSASQRNLPAASILSPTGRGGEIADLNGAGQRIMSRSQSGGPPRGGRFSARSANEPQLDDDIGGAVLPR